MESTQATSTTAPSHRLTHCAAFDVLVVGGGAAGLYASLCLPSHVRVGLVTKDALNSGSSRWAQGGIAAAIYPPDSPQYHLEDTLKAGMGLCDAAAVQFLVDHAATAIAALQALRVDFDHSGPQLATTLEAAHSFPRVLHSRDTTGHAIVDVLMAAVWERPNIQVFSRAMVLSLWCHPQTGHCQGVSLLHEQQISWIQATAVVLATGGGGQVFAKTTNPTVSTGDGVALAWRAGAIIRDVEFMQFHPTALMKPGAPHFLISEAVRGEGAHLVDNQGQRFAFDYHPAGELAPRNVVSRAIFTHLQKTTTDPAHAHVYLDMRPIAPEQIRRRFPNIAQVCQHWGIDVFHDLIPVAPAAHYWMGGIACDLMNRSSIPGLYTIGETASTGVHGANRLASNSLLECVVFAAQLSHLTLPPLELVESPPMTLAGDNAWYQAMDHVTAIRHQVPRLMWKHAGICRSASGLETAIATLTTWRTQFAALAISQCILNLSPRQTIQLPSAEAAEALKTTAETLNLLDIASLILHSAAFRTESRGGHYRLDYPEPLAHWQVHTLVQGDRWWTQPVNTSSSPDITREPPWAC